MMWGAGAVWKREAVGERPDKEGLIRGWWRRDATFNAEAPRRVTTDVRGDPVADRPATGTAA